MSSRYGTLEDVNGNKIYPNPYYKIGDIFITTRNDDPAERFGGTWEQIKSDAYLKIVTSEAGTLGGTSSDHKIPISSMPNHNHNIKNFNSWGATTATGAGYQYYPERTDKMGNNGTEYRGDGEPYYPYYYGIYVWIRVA
jgi:hypothetical protein